MPVKPLELDRGPKWLRQWSKRMVDWVQSGRPLRSEDCEVHETDSGTQILPRAKRTIASTVVQIPLGLIAINGESENQIRVFYGTIGNRMADSMSLGDDPQCIIDHVTGDGYVYAEIQHSARAVNSWDVNLYTDPQASGGGTAFVELGTYSTDGDGTLHVASNDLGSKQAFVCGDDVTVWT